MKIRKFNENLEEKKLQKVRVMSDDDGHNFVLPLDLAVDFYTDSENEDFIDSGGFDNKYGKYSTGGDLNNIQLYAEI